MIYNRSLALPEESFFLFGPRGTGKSLWIESNLKGSKIFDLLDEGLFSELIAQPKLFQDMIRSVSKNVWIVLDEVQRVPSLLNEVHRSIEREKRKFVLCGSSAKKLRTQGVNLLASRAIELRMHPFTFDELGDDFSLTETLQYGVIPIIWSAKNKKEKLKAYVQTYLSQEIQAQALVRNLPGFFRFLPVAALYNAQVINISNIARDCGVARTTVEGYIEILIETLLGFKLEAYSARLRVKEVKHPKFYFCDPGLTRGIKKVYGNVTPEEIGALFEAWLIQQVRAYNDYFDLFDEMYYWQSHTSSVEVDLLIRRGKSFIAVEIKSSDKFHASDGRGLKAISELPGLKRRILVYRGRQHLKTAEGIEVIPYQEFLNDLKDGL